MKKLRVLTVVKASLIRSKMKNRKILVAVSGGADSMALLSALKYFEKSFSLTIVPIYVHHGGKNSGKAKHRNEAQQFLQKRFADLRVEKSETSLSSESELREFRYEVLKDKIKELKCDVIAVAHHEDDLLETRLIRLIRGSGIQGIESMSELRDQIWRPLLTVSQKEILDFCKHLKIEFLKDPSNNDIKYFRNWIRKKWLPELEMYRAGSKKSLLRSLENLTPKESLNVAHLLSEEGIARSELISLSKQDQRRAVAEFLRQRKIKNYTSSQIDEILKRLDSPKKELIFKIVGCDWTVDTKHINCKQDG